MLNNEINVLHQQYGMGSYLHILLNLTLTVLIPLITGQILHSIWTEKVIWLDSKFHFSVINSICLLILVWSTFCDLFQSKSLKTIHEFDLIILILLNAFLYIIFSLLAMFIARLPNIFICHKQIIDNDQQPLLLEDNQKSKRTLIERWRFSREDTIAIMFCCTTKTVAKGVTLINAVNYKNNEDLMGLISLPLVLYYIEQQMIASVEVILLQNWLKSKTDTN
jgi:sodium/bile acid cotransporter 7